MAAESKKQIALRNTVFKVEKLQMKDAILKQARLRGDNWGREVEVRLSSEGFDMVAMDCRYHKFCHRKFYQQLSESKKPVGRPESLHVQSAMESIYSYLSEHRDECQFLLIDLIKQIKSDEVPETKTIKHHLKEHYGEKLLIVEDGQGKKTFVCCVCVFN